MQKNCGYGECFRHSDGAACLGYWDWFGCGTQLSTQAVSEVCVEQTVVTTAVIRKDERSAEGRVEEYAEERDRAEWAGSVAEDYTLLRS